MAGAATLAHLSIREFTGTTAQLARLIDVQSIILSYADATYLIGFLGVVCLPLVFLLRKPKPAARDISIGE